MIWLTQCKCPQGHCITAAAWDPANQTAESAEAELRQAMKELEDKGVMRPWCDICLGREFRFESRETPFKTMEEAMGPLKAHETLQRIVNAIRSYQNQRPPTKPN